MYSCISVMAFLGDIKSSQICICACVCVWSPPLRLTNQNFAHSSHLPMRTTCPAHPILFYLIILIIFRSNKHRTVHTCSLTLGRGGITILKWILNILCGLDSCGSGLGPLVGPCEHGDEWWDCGSHCDEYDPDHPGEGGSKLLWNVGETTRRCIPEDSNFFTVIDLRVP
jgi:hypothetical protein